MSSNSCQCIANITSCCSVDFSQSYIAPFSEHLHLHLHIDDIFLSCKYIIIITYKYCTDIHTYVGFRWDLVNRGPDIERWALHLAEILLARILLPLVSSNGPKMCVKSDRNAHPSVTKFGISSSNALKRPTRCLLKSHQTRFSNQAFSFFTSTVPAAAAPPCFRFFAFSFSFALLRSLFFRPLILVLHTSAYFAKKVSNPSASTIVDSLIFLSLFSLDLPFVARMMRGRGCEGFRSENGWPDAISDVS